MSLNSFLPATWMMNNSKGEKSATLTFAFISFWVMVFAIIGPMFNGMVIHNFTITIQKPDTVLLLSTLGVSFLSYIKRRGDSDKNGNGVDDPGNGK